MELITFEQMYLCGKNVSLWCDVSLDQSFMVLFLIPAKGARFSSVLYLIAVKGSGVINQHRVLQTLTASFYHSRINGIDHL